MIASTYDFNLLKLCYLFIDSPPSRTHDKEMLTELYVDMEVTTSTTVNPHWKNRTMSQTTQ